MSADLAAPSLTRTAFEREHPELFEQLRTEFTEAGAAAERERSRIFYKQKRRDKKRASRNKAKALASLSNKDSTQ